VEVCGVEDCGVEDCGVEGCGVEVWGVEVCGVLPLTFGRLGRPQGTDDLTDAVLRADAVRTHVSPLDDLRGGNLRF